MVVPPPPKQAPTPPRRRVLVIDPGHGGIDPGAIGSGGTYEKDIVLAMALELRRQLEATGRYEVVMTRETDSIMRLRDRLQTARESDGELFLSLHADSLVQAPEVRGASVYTLSEQASNEEAARLAGKENRADILAGIDLSDQEDIVTEILIDLAQRDANNKSIRLAELLVGELTAGQQDGAPAALAGRLRGAQVARHAIGADRARLSLQRRGRAGAAGSGSIWRCWPGRWCRRSTSTSTPGRS